MSNITAIPSQGCGLTINGTWVESTDSSVVGYEWHEGVQRYRIKRYQFTTPKDINGAPITRISGLTVNFPIVDLNSTHNPYDWGVKPYVSQDWNGNDMHLYCYISTNRTITVEQLRGNIGKFEIEFDKYDENNKPTRKSQPKPINITQELQPDTTYYLFIHSNTPANDAFRARYWSTDNATIETVDITYTKCTAPTSISVNSNIVTPNNIIISWSGAQSGISNSISGYKIYYKSAANPTLSSYDGVVFISTASTSGSKAITVSEEYRGEQLYFGIQTIGSVTGYDSVNITTGASAKINQLPSQPTVSLSSTKVPSTGGSITINGLSAIDNDNQDISYYYSIANGPKRSITPGTSLAFNIESIVKFWSYDGLEYSSSSAEITIKLNTKPTDIVLSNNPNNITANGKSGYATKHNGSITSKTRVITSKVELIYENIIVKTYNTSTAEYDISDIELQLKQYYTNSELIYTLKFYAVDSLEAFYIDEKAYKLPAAPNTISSKVDGNTVFYKKIIFTYHRDTSATSYSFSSIIDNVNIIESQSYQIGTDNIVTHTVNINSKCPSNTTVTFTLEAAGGLNKQTVYFSKSGYIPNTQISVNWGMTTFSPFQNVVDKTKQVTSLNVQNPFTEGYNNYNVKQIELKIFNSKGDKKIIISNNNYSSDNLIFSVSGLDIFNTEDFNSNTYGLKDKNGWNGTHTLSAQIVIINNSNIEFSITNISTIYLNFDYPPASCNFEIKYGDYFYYENKNGEMVQNFLIQEGMNLNFLITLRPYTKKAYEAILEYSFDDTNFLKAGQTTFNILDEDKDGAYGYYNKNNQEITPGTQIQTISFLVPRVTSTTTSWRIRVVGSSIEATGNFPSIKHQEISNLKIISGEKAIIGSNEDGIKLTYDFSYQGYDYEALTQYIKNDVTCKVNFNNKSPEIVSFVHESKNVTFKNDNTASPPYQVELLINQTITQTYINYSHTITTTTPIFIIYFDAPTVSYRHNCIGINTPSPENESSAVLVISPTSSKNAIILNTLDGDNFNINATNGAILINFVINGGTWD